MKRDRKLHPRCMGCWQKGKYMNDVGWIHRRCVKVAIYHYVEHDRA